MSTWKQHYTASLNLRPRFPALSVEARDLRPRHGQRLPPPPQPCRALMVVESQCRAIVAYVPPQPMSRSKLVSNGKSAEEPPAKPQVAATTPLKSPYPFFGGKAKVAEVIWQRFGNPKHFIDPFFGSGAVLLARPDAPDLELVNDIDGLICNFWRAVQDAPDQVASYADYPVFESDLHARHAWLVSRKDSLQSRLEGDPDYYDPKIAGWWAWGMSNWIGSGFCSGEGSWVVENGRLVKVDQSSVAGIGRQLPKVVDRSLKSDYVTEFPTLIKRRLPHLTSFQGVQRAGIKRNRPEVSAMGKGVQRKMPEAVSNRGVQSERAANGGIYAYFEALQERFRHVRVTCGDWSRVVTPAVLDAKSPCAILLDPPYSHEGREAGLYAHDDASLYAEVRAWAIAHGDDPNLRIAYCGYADGFAWPEGWEKLAWKANGGYSNQGEERRDNPFKECIWFSPHCLKLEPEDTQLSLFN